MKSVLEKLKAGDYEVPHSHPHDGDLDYDIKCGVCHADAHNCMMRFKEDLINEVKLVDHPRVDQIWEFAVDEANYDKARIYYYIERISQVLGLIPDPFA